MKNLLERMRRWYWGKVYAFRVWQMQRRMRALQRNIGKALSPSLLALAKSMGRYAEQHRALLQDARDAGLVLEGEEE